MPPQNLSGKPTMQDRFLYEYAVIRVVPRVEREEFINVGVVLYCAQHKTLEVKYHLPTERLQALAPNLDLQDVESHLQAFESIAKGEKSAGPIAGLPVPDRFRWLTATRSTIVQSSKVHIGYCSGLAHEAERLFVQLVL